MAEQQRVFMSYTPQDRPLLNSALKWLRTSDLSGAEVDDPVDWSALGDDVQNAIKDKVARADTMLLVWSDRAAKSPWVLYEVGLAQALGVPIRALLARGSRAKLPIQLPESDVVELNSHEPEHTSNAGLKSASISAKLESLKQERRTIDEQIRELTKAAESANSPAAGKKRRLSAAARKRIAAFTEKRRYGKRQPVPDPEP